MHVILSVAWLTVPIAHTDMPLLKRPSAIVEAAGSQKRRGPIQQSSGPFSLPSSNSRATFDIDAASEAPEVQSALLIAGLGAFLGDVLLVHNIESFPVWSLARFQRSHKSFAQLRRCLSDPCRQHSKTHACFHLAAAFDS